ncbi:MAG: glutamine amidotransferase [Acidobacteria bacterium]|nr:glutamine amidotransferase [Acidobacteriota bacterium]
MSGSTVRVGLVYPELLGTYGDRGNAVVLVDRLRWRGLDAELVEVAVRTPLPEQVDMLVIGGGEDAAQLAALDELRPQVERLRHAVEREMPILAVCAGFQLLGSTISLAGRRDPVEGLGLYEGHTAPTGSRWVGEALLDVGLEGVGPVSGFENHGASTTLGPGEQPLGRIRRPAGEDRTDGVVHGSLVGTYLHGPVLARNPALADHLLARVVGELGPIDDDLAAHLHRARLDSLG